MKRYSFLYFQSFDNPCLKEPFNCHIKVFFWGGFGCSWTVLLRLSQTQLWSEFCLLPTASLSFSLAEFFLHYPNVIIFFLENVIGSFACCRLSQSSLHVQSPRVKFSPWAYLPLDIPLGKFQRARRKIFHVGTILSYLSLSPIYDPQNITRSDPDRREKHQVTLHAFKTAFIWSVWLESLCFSRGQKRYLVYIKWRGPPECGPRRSSCTHLQSAQRLPIASLSSPELLSDLFTCSPHVAQAKGRRA